MARLPPPPNVGRGSAPSGESTAGEDAAREAAAARLPSSVVDLPDEYQKNIQTVELNALNAAMAVFMYKKYRGYYASGRSVYQASFTTSSMQLDRESAD